MPVGSGPDTYVRPGWFPPTIGKVTWMGLRWSRLLKIGDDFLEAAPLRYVNTIDVTASTRHDVDS